MTTEQDDSSPRQQRLTEVLAVYLKSVETNNEDNQSKWLQRYPEFAGELKNFFAGQEKINQITAPLRIGVRSADVSSTESRLGDFRIIREIGRGGMGVVYEAEQISIGRHVALKVLPFASVLDKRQLNRFKNEARAAGTLDHPNIVSVYVVGTERGVHYYAMQLVEGQSLAELIADLRKLQHTMTDERAPGNGHITAATVKSLRALCSDTLNSPSEQQPSESNATPTIDTKRAVQSARSTLSNLDTREYFRTVAQLGIQAAQALEHAHQNGIVHRDVKPGNLLVDADGKLWVTDFGLARIEADAGITMTGDVLGTFRYMSPEQALAKRGVVVDHRTDVYSLGVTLYELLTLRPALLGNDRKELLNQIVLAEPLAPRRINASISVDLETIVLKAMAKDPVQRYATAQEFADDLERYVDQKPILAKRPSLLEKTQKWSRRHHSIVKAVALMALVATIGLAVSTVLIRRQRDVARAAVIEAKSQERIAEEQKRIVKEQKRTAETLLARAQLDRGIRLLEDDNFLGLLDLVEARSNAEHDPNLRDSIDTLWSGWHQQYADLLIHIMGHDGPVYDVTFSPDGQQFVTAAGDGTIRFWDPVSGAPLNLPLRHGAASVRVAEFSPTGDLLATGAADGSIRLWNTSTFEPQGPLLMHGKGVVRRIAFSADGTLLASGAEYHAAARLWQTATGEPHGRPIPQKSEAFDLAFSPNGKLLAVASNGRSFGLWDTATCKRHGPLLPHWNWLTWVCFSPDGKVLYTGSHENTVKSWETETGRLLGEAARTARLSRCALSPDGMLLATASMDRATQIWSPSDGAEVSDPIRNTNLVATLAFSPDGRLLATCSTDGTARLWNSANATPRGPPLQHQGPVRAIAFSPDGQLLATASDDGSVRIWSTSVPQYVMRFSPSSYDDSGGGDVEFSRNGHILAAAAGHTVQVMNLNRRSDYTLRCDAPVVDLAFSTDGHLLATATENEVVQLWDINNHPPSTVVRCTQPGRFVAFRQDAEVLATGAAWKDHRVHFCDPKTLLPTRPALPRSRTGMKALAFAPSGGLLACAADEVQLWDTDAGLPMLISFPINGVHQLAFSPAGNNLAIASHDAAAFLFDVATGKLVAKPFRHRADVASVTFHCDGNLLATGSYDGSARIWDLRDKSSAHSIRFTHPGAVRGVCFNSAGTLLATTCSDGIVRLWPAPNSSVSLEEMRVKTWVALGSRLNDEGQVEAIPWQQWRAVEADATNRDYRREAAFRNMQFARQQERDADTDQALASYRAAKSRFEQLADEHLDLGICKGLADATDGVAKIHRIKRLRASDISGRFQSPEQVYRYAVDVVQKRSAESPRNLKYQHELLDIYLYLGSVLTNTGQVQKAAEVYLRALALREKLAAAEPNEPAHAIRSRFTDDLVYLAGTLVNVPDPGLRDPDLALRLTRQAIALWPENGPYWATQGYAHCRLGQGQAALDALEKSRKLGFEHPNRVYLALTHWQLGNDQQARQWYDRYADWQLKTHSRHVPFRRLRCEAATTLGITPENPRSRMELAWFLVTNPDPRLRDPKKAHALVRQTIKEHPDEADFITLGATLIALGDDVQSKLAFGLASQSRQNVPVWKDRLAWRYILWPDEPRDRQTALSLATDAVEAKPENGAFLVTLGAVHYRLGQYERALEALRNALALRRHGPDLNHWLLLAMTHWKLGDRDEARKCYQDAVAMSCRLDQHISLRLHAEAKELSESKDNL